jgi:hypothetical protein
MPLFLRISATDWLEEEPGIEASWKVEDTIRLAEVIADMGVDLLDVSSGGLHPKQKLKTGPGYQAPFAKAVKEKLGDKLAVGTVGTITSGKQANQLLEEGLDLIIVGRMFQKNPGLVWSFAEELGVQVNVANQIRWYVLSAVFLSSWEPLSASYNLLREQQLGLYCSDMSYNLVSYYRRVKLTETCIGVLEEDLAHLRGRCNQSRRSGIVDGVTYL